MIDRRSILRCAAGLCVSPALAARAADAWPSRPVTLVSASPAGGNADVIGRVLAVPLAAALKVAVLVEPRPGATGMIAAAYVAKSPPDGYTLLLGSIATHAIAPSIHRSLPYDVVRDFTPVAMVGSNSLILAVSAKSPYRTVADIVAAARANPGTLSIGSPGVGGTSHLSGELFQHLTGTQLIHVPNARNPAYADVIGGTTTMLFEGSVALLSHIRSGLLRPIAVTGLARSPQLLDVPTMIEAGVAGFDVRSWQAIFGPAGMPPTVVERLHREFTAAVHADTSRQRMATLDITPIDMTPAALATFQGEEIAKWANVVRVSKIEAR